MRRHAHAAAGVGQLGLLPRIRTRHTSSDARGQIYIPAVNAALMLACLALVVGFKSSGNLASAYGIAVVLTMVITSVLFALAARVVWNWPLTLTAIVLAGLLLLGSALGLLITPIGMLYTDVGRGIGILAQFGMLLTPVVYPPRETGIVGWLTQWNPISPPLITARDWLTGQTAAFSGGFWAVTAVSLVVFVVAWFFYRLTMPLLVERMGG